MISKTMIKTAKTIASDNCVEIYALDRFSMTPSKRPPMKAPGMDPIPPNTAAVKALMPGIEPSVGYTEGYVEHSNTAAIAANPDPIAKVMDMVLFTFIPISLAASLSSEQALMARPILVLLMKKVSTIMITMQVNMVSRFM